MSGRLFLFSAVAGGASLYCFKAARDLWRSGETVLSAKDTTIAELVNSSEGSAAIRKDVVDVQGQVRACSKAMGCTLNDKSTMKVVYQRSTWREKLYSCQIAQRNGQLLVDCHESWRESKCIVGEVQGAEKRKGRNSDRTHSFQMHDGGGKSVFVFEASDEAMDGIARRVVDTYAPSTNDTIETKRRKQAHTALYISVAVAKASQAVAVDTESIEPLVLGTKKTVDVVAEGDFVHVIGRPELHNERNGSRVVRFNKDALLSRSGHQELGEAIQRDSDNKRFYAWLFAIPSIASVFTGLSR